MKHTLDWSAILMTLAMIIVIRESCVWVTGHFGHPELGNLIGLGVFLIILVIWRSLKQIPHRMVDASTVMMRESAFAFLPISGGAILMLIAMGKDVPLFLFVMVFSTLLPLWVYAKLAKRWL